MGAEKDIIVAVELASTAIRAIAGRRETDGTVQILAVVQEESANAIHKGIVDNIDKTTQAIRSVVKQLNDKLGIYTKRIYVGLAGQSLRSKKNPVVRQFEEKTQISPQIVDEMKDSNLAIDYPESEILDVIPQEYRINNRQVADPVGMQGDSIEANFLNVVARTSLKENIEKCVHDAGFELAELLISPICLADALLPESEKASGVALADMGAETTTVCVYDRGILRHLAVIPLGGDNITADITRQNIETHEAEMLKRKYGTTYRNEPATEAVNSISLSHSRKIDELTLQEIIEARYEELFLNISHQVDGRSERLLSGYVFTGGAARVKDLVQGFSKQAHTDKLVRVAEGMPEGIKAAPGVTIDEPDTLYTLMALLRRGDQPCVGEPPAEEQSEIDFDHPEPQPEPIPEPEPETQPTPEPESEKPKAPKESFGEKMGRWWQRLDDIFSEKD